MNEYLLSERSIDKSRIGLLFSETFLDSVCIDGLNEQISSKYEFFVKLMTQEENFYSKI